MQDYGHSGYTRAPTDGSAWESGGQQDYRVLRGGSWYNAVAVLRSANRSINSPDYRYSIIGFRLAKSTL